MARDPDARDDREAEEWTALNTPDDSCIIRCRSPSDMLCPYCARMFRILYYATTAELSGQIDER